MDVLSAVAAFAVVAGMLTLVPGLDTALVLRSSVTAGRKHAFATALGINTGTLVWGIAAAAGVSALLAASSTAYSVLRLVGAAYMIWLGGRIVWRTWRQRGRRAGARPQERPAPARPDHGVARSWLLGLTTNLLNPKVGAFYVAMIPQFIPPDIGKLTMGVLLALVHNAEGMVWFTALILGAHLAHDWLAKRIVRQAVDTVTGTVLLAFGVRLALSHR